MSLCILPNEVTCYDFLHIYATVFYSMEYQNKLDLNQDFYGYNYLIYLV